MLRFAAFELDDARGELRRSDGTTVRLRPKAFQLLRYLAENAGRIVSKQELMDAVWPAIHVGEDSLFQCIREIRAAVGDEHRQLIKAVSGRGYLVDKVRGAEGEPLPLDAEPPVPPQPAQVVVFDEPAGGHLRFSMSRRTIMVAASFVVSAICLAAATPFVREHVLAPRPPVIAIAPFTDATGSLRSAQLAARVSEGLADGLSKIPTIRILARTANNVAAPAGTADVELRGEIAKEDNSWTVHARLVNPATDEVRWTTTYSVAVTGVDESLQQSRLIAGVGYPLAVYISAMRHSSLRDDNAKIVIEQANAFINRTSREKFETALQMLEKALADDPENVDLQTALASQLIRGIQTVWVRGRDAEKAETDAKKLLERAFKAEPNYIPVLESYCRFLTATNRFVESLVACSKSLTLDPWDGLVLFQLGLSQLQLGRFDDALSTFKQADWADTPQVSRWTWLLGDGLTYLFLDRPADAVLWLNRSLAITPGTGRTHFLLAAAYQSLGRHEDAEAAIKAGLALRPGSTKANVALPEKNASSIFLKRSEQVKLLMVAAGLPER